jgi:transposase-like protein
MQRNGSYFRKGDSRHIRLYKCAKCGAKMSDATGTRTFNQKKRRINNDVFELLCMGVSQRAIAKKLGITRTTVVRRLQFWSEISVEDNTALLNDYFARHPQAT